jgi:hypothetical protein
MNLTITSGREEVENNLSQSIGELGLLSINLLFIFNIFAKSSK